MNIQIKYRSLVTKDAINEAAFNELLFQEIGTYHHKELDLFKHFSTNKTNLKLEDQGLKFQYNQENRTIEVIVSYHSIKPLTINQSEEMVKCTTELMDRGYYGEDGWFVDISPGYYVLLIDPKHIKTQPISVSIN